MKEAWTPALASTDALAAAANDAVNAIASAVEKGVPPQIGEGEFPQDRDIPRRPHRLYDEALLFAYLAVARDDERLLDLTGERLNLATEKIRRSARGLGLYGGICGLAWTVQHLSSSLGIEFQSDSDEGNDDSLLTSVDTFLISRLQSGPWTGDYDLISGLVGIGIYFLERMPSDSAAQGIKLIIHELERLSQRTEAGITWFTPPELIPDAQREIAPGGYYNLGVAHGIPGVLFLLSEVAALGIEQERVSAMLESAMEWFLAQARPSSSTVRFSGWVPTPESRGDQRGRLSWCYGDLGILAVLTQIAKRTGHPKWQTFTAGLLDECVSRPDVFNGLVDPMLCHGTMGNAHIFTRLYQMTGDARCRGLALKFLEAALAMRRPEGGVGGFYAVISPDPTAGQTFALSASFLDGAIGLALSLLSAVTPMEPAWDRLLLLSGRSTRHPS